MRRFDSCLPLIFHLTASKAALAVLLGTTCLAMAQGAAPSKENQTGPTVTFPQFIAGQKLWMVAYGDSRFTDPATTSGTNPRVRKWLAERIAEEHPQAILLTGDTPFTGAKDADWQDFQAETAPWRAQHVLQLPATGNHEINGGPEQGIANYLANFPDIHGHRYYSALLGSVEVISLDCTLPAGNSTPQARWFATQLDHLPAQVEFLLILYHIPWMADRQSQVLIGLPSKDSLVFRGILEERLSGMHAKVVVFNGHIHNYERFERRGVEYVVTGGGGAEPYPILYRGPADLYRDLSFPVYNYVTVEVNNHQLHAVMWKVKDPEFGTLAVEAKDQFILTAAPAIPQHPKRRTGSKTP